MSSGESCAFCLLQAQPKGGASEPRNLVWESAAQKLPGAPRHFPPPQALLFRARLCICKLPPASSGSLRQVETTATLGQPQPRPLALGHAGRSASGFCTVALFTSVEQATTLPTTVMWVAARGGGGGSFTKAGVWQRVLMFDRFSVRTSVTVVDPMGQAHMPTETLVWKWRGEAQSQTSTRIWTKRNERQPLEF